MEKKQYSIPLTEVVVLNTALMQAFGSASMPTDDFKNNAPRRTKVF